MQMRNAVKVIITLLVILILLLTSILIITRRTEQNGDGTGDTEKPSSTEKDDSSGTDPINKPDSTDSSDTNSSDTVQDTTDSGTVSSEEETFPSSEETTIPSDFSFSKTLRSDTGTPLNLRAECRGVREENGKVRVTVLLYLDYQSLNMGSRSGCRHSIGDVSETFSIPAIKEDSEEAHTQYLCHVEKVCEYGDTVSVYARLPFRGSYSGVELEILEIDSTVKIQ